MRKGWRMEDRGYWGEYRGWTIEDKGGVTEIFCGFTRIRDDKK